MYVTMTPEATAPPYSNAIVEVELPLHNHAALEQLKQERDRLSIEVAATGAAGIATSLAVSPIGLFFFALAYPPTIQIEKLTRIINVMEELLTEFEPMGIQIYPAMEAEGENNAIDLFLRFPRQLHIFISIRSKGDAKVSFHEDKKSLYVRREKKGKKDWNPCPLTELNSYTTWLNRQRLRFNMSSKEARNVPLTKLLVLWEPTKLEDHPQHLYLNIGSVEVVGFRHRGLAFVYQREDVTKFVAACLSKYPEPIPQKQ
jgi:hypothetical protein